MILPRSPMPGPSLLWVVRHGESAGNVARDRAYAERLDRIELAARDVDIELSDEGREQSRALGQSLAALPDPPTALWVSPYVRARQTAELALAEAGLTLPCVVDERLREREFGVLDGLTGQGIRAEYPEEAERRRKLGKFYHRPPGGESWSDVLLRVRAALTELTLRAQGERVLLVGHQVGVLLVRYVLEQLDEPGILAIDAEGDVANCSLTTYRDDGDGLRLQTYNDVGHLAQSPAALTAEQDAPRAAR